jgi:hypothetical protein
MVGVWGVGWESENGVLYSREWVMEMGRVFGDKEESGVEGWMRVSGFWFVFVVGGVLFVVQVGRRWGGCRPGFCGMCGDGRTV